MEIPMLEHFEALPDGRKKRLEFIRDALEGTQPKVELTMKYRMPAFEWNGNWACLGNQKHHLLEKGRAASPRPQ